MKVRTDALYKVQTAPIQGTFFRYIRTRYSDEPLSMHGSFENGGRYNVAKLFGALYLGFDRETCEAEVSQGIAAGVQFKAGAFTAWSYDADLQTVVRLDDPGIQNELEIQPSDITVQGDHWTASEIGEHLHKRGVEGIVAPSAQQQDGLCLDVFLDRVKARSHVTPKEKLGTWP